MVKQLQDEKQWLEQESKRQVDESERKLENVRAAELQELRRGKVEALQLLQVSSPALCLLPSDSSGSAQHWCWRYYVLESYVCVHLSVCLSVHSRFLYLLVLDEWRYFNKT